MRWRGPTAEWPTIQELGHCGLPDGVTPGDALSQANSIPTDDVRRHGASGVTKAHGLD